MREKHRFQNKRFLFSKTYYRVSVNILHYTPRRIARSFFRNSHGSASEMNCWTTLQGNSSETLPLKFLSQPFSIFHFFHVMHSHLSFWVAPMHMKCIMSFPNHTCQYINYAYINKIYIHTTYYLIHINNIKISSLELINNPF